MWDSYNHNYDIVDKTIIETKEDCDYITNILYSKYDENKDYDIGLFFRYGTIRVGRASNSDYDGYWDWKAFLYDAYPHYDEIPVSIYRGQYSSISEAAKEREIAAGMFISEMGYRENFSQGVYFTIFIGEDGYQKQEIHKICIRTERGTTSVNQNNETIIKFSGIKDKDGNNVSYYSISNTEDSYSEYNYLTILVGEDVSLTALAPEFSCSKGMTLYAENGSSPEISGKSIHDFSNGAVQYTVSAENGVYSKNYWLQIVKPRSQGRKLYINSLIDNDADTRIENDIIYSNREVFLDSYHDYIHDILMINMGTNMIPSLMVELISDEIELNDYWTLRGKYELLGFSDRSKLNNLAKIRIQAKDGIQDGTQASGKLIIKSEDTVLMELTLTGVIGDPCIITKEIPPAVEYVPYGTMIQNNNKYSWNRVTYTIVEGGLPEGMELKSNGELYGVPMKSGTFPITLKATNSSSEFGSSSATLVLTVNENTNANVYTASDEGYIIENPIGTEVAAYDYILKEAKDQLFVSSGEYSEFVDFWLNGKKLIDGVDYTKDSGSTRITI